MARLLYFLPVRGHLVDSRLMAAFDGAQNINADNAINAETRGGIVATMAKTAADVDGSPNAESSKAAVVVILTYADIDIAAARLMLNALPVCGGGVFCLLAQTPEGAPFLSTLRERVNALQNDKNAVVVMELPAAAEASHYDDAAAKLREMILADDETMGDETNDEDGVIMHNPSNNKTPEQAVRMAHKAVEDLL